LFGTAGGQTSGMMSFFKQDGTALNLDFGGTSSIQVSVSPSSATVQPGGTQQFTASVSGTNNNRVTWSVNGIPGGNAATGTISGTGLYTSPTVVPNPPTVTITATSAADSTKSATASLTIQTSTNLTINPATVDILINSGNTAIGAYQATISYDKNLVQLVDSNVTGGNAPGFTSKPATVNVDSAAGKVTITQFQVGASPAGNFSVARLTFTPLRAGTTALILSGVSLTDAQGNDVNSAFLSVSTSSLIIR